MGHDGLSSIFAVMFFLQMIIKKRHAALVKALESFKNTYQELSFKCVRNETTSINGHNVHFFYEMVISDDAECEYIREQMNSIKTKQPRIVFEIKDRVLFAAVL